MMPIVSVVTPSYNCDDFVLQTYQCLCAQDFLDWEWLFIDDCSTDNTHNIMARIAASDERVIYIVNDKNIGAAASRNKAIGLARGRYIAFLDSDDLWSADKLVKQIGFMQKTGAGFTYTGYSTMSESGNVMDRIDVPSKVNFSRMLKHNYIGCLTAIYDTKPFGKIYMPMVRKRQDFALWLELLKKFDFAYGLQENLGFYRIRVGSLSSSKVDAFKFYWNILRNVAKQSMLSSVYYILCYLFIVVMKKKFVNFYNKFFTN